MKNKKIILAVIALVAVACLMLGIYVGIRENPAPSDNGQETDPENIQPQGSKKITVTVVHKDGTEKSFTCYTDEEYLGPVLVKEKIVEDNQEGFGLYIKVADGERADYTLDQAYWAIYEGENEAMTGADEITIQDGDSFKLVYTGA